MNKIFGTESKSGIDTRKTSNKEKKCERKAGLGETVYGICRGECKNQ